MPNLSKFDFSKESSIKDSLLQKCRERYDQNLKQTKSVSDDELELVAAAGATPAKKCPTPLLPCESCPRYSPDADAVNPCTEGCVK